jgi:hypothetical protein
MPAANDRANLSRESLDEDTRALQLVERCTVRCTTPV